MTLRLYPLPSLYDDAVARVRAATPVDTSSFYLKKPYNVPWSVLPTTFVLETEYPGDPHTFTINRTEQFTIIPGSSPTSISLTLSQGANRIEIETPTFASKGLWREGSFYQRYDAVGYDGTVWICLQPNVGVRPESGPFWELAASLSGTRETVTYTVASTGVQTWFQALGREVYLSAEKRLIDVQNQMLSPWTTRVAAHFLPFTELFIPARMPKIHQTRLAICVSMGQRLGFGDGVIGMATAVSYSTPYVTKAEESEFNTPGMYPDYPYVSTNPTTGELRGRLLDIWSPNQCLASKLALTQLSLAVGSNDTPEPKPLELLDVDDYQALVSVNGGLPEVHSFNPSSAECANVEFDTNCLGDLRVFAKFEGVLDVFMNTPQLPFDTVVEQPLLFGFWDEGNTLDMSAGSGDPGLGGGDERFDTVDQDDPFGSGFAGVPLSRRFDAPMCLDSRIQLGHRMVRHTSPVLSTGGLTPSSESPAGTPLVIDLTTPGAPGPIVGATRFWATSPLNFIYQGDFIRVENPDADIQISGAWPVFDPLNIRKEISVTVTTLVGEVRVSSAGNDFSKLSEGWGVELSFGSMAYYASIARVINSTEALLAGNGAIPDGSYTARLYLPMRDPHAVGPVGSGHRLYDIQLATGLPGVLLDDVHVDHRHAPRAFGNHIAGSEVIKLASDQRVTPGDRLYFDSSAWATVVIATESGAHPTTGYKVYDVLLDQPISAPLTVDQALFAVTTDACWLGDPVTVLKLITVLPEDFVIP